MKLRLLLPALAAALLATACFRVEFAIDVQDDGSVEIEAISAVNPDQLGELGGLLGEGGTDLDLSREEQCADIRADQDTTELDGSDLDVTVEDYDEDGFCGSRIRATGTPEQAAEIFSNTSDGLAGDEVILREEADGGWTFELPLDTGDSGELDSFPGADALLDSASFVVKVRLPGRQIDHNADFIESDGTMVWELSLTSPPDRLFARTEPGDRITGSGDGGDGGSKLWIVLVVAALVLAGALAFFLMKRKKDSSQDAAPVDGAARVAGIDPPGSPLSPQAPPSQAPAQDFAPIPSPDPTTPMPVMGSSAPDRPASDTTEFGAGATAAPSPSDQPEPAPQPDPAPQPSPEAATAPANGPEVIAGPTPEQATGQPVWDPTRRAYVQWDPGASRWLVFDDATGQWKPEQ